MIPAAPAVSGVLLASAAFFAVASAGQAQDVEMLGRMYGTTPPPEYFARRAADATAFEYERALFRRLPGVERSPLESLGGSSAGAVGVPLLQGARSQVPPFGVVSGTFTFPLLLGLFSDSDSLPPHARGVVQSHFFDGPNPDGTIREYYGEASGGMVDLLGQAFEWGRTTLTVAEVAGGSSGLGSTGRVAEFIVQLVAQIDSTGIDWGAYDNDGPDGVPNSGDDDGFVDVVAVMHPTAGAECGGNHDSDRVWSHRWSVAAQVGTAFLTSTPGASGGSIKVNDYTIQPVLSCNGSDVNEIGVFAHELGHSFGLPDLYAVGGKHAAAGQWDLMGTGSWGCPGVFRPARPCQMGAWTKSVLGWVSEVELAGDLDHGVVTAVPVLSGRSVYRIESGDGGDDYFLIENRQRQGFDGDVPDPGILIWQVDAGVVVERWPINAVNVDPDRMGVRVVQADGRNQLGMAGGGRGDSGDIFPGTSAATAFHAGTSPASISSDGGATGVTVLDITRSGLDVRFRLLTRYQHLTLQAPGATGAGLFRVDGGALLPSGSTVRSAPFHTRTVEAAEADPLADGIRAPFQSWDDGSPRLRAFQAGLTDATLAATYAGREVELRISHVAVGQEVVPGVLLVQPAAPSSWVPESSTVTIEAQAKTGFTFMDWTGDLAGETNPVTVVASAPITAAALYDVTFMVVDPPSRIELEGGLTTDVSFQVENGTLPTIWTLEEGSLPEGLSFGLDGHLRGVPLATGEFGLRLRVVDGIGLIGQVDLVLAVVPTRATPETLAMPFLGTGAGPSLGQRDYLDRQGNRNGRYDLGDLRAFLTSGGGPDRATATGEPRTEIRLEIPVRVRGGPPANDLPGGGERR